MTTTTTKTVDIDIPAVDRLLENARRLNKLSADTRAEIEATAKASSSPSRPLRPWPKLTIVFISCGIGILIGLGMAKFIL